MRKVKESESEKMVAGRGCGVGALLFCEVETLTQFSRPPTEVPSEFTHEIAN